MACGILAGVVTGVMPFAAPPANAASFAGVPLLLTAFVDGGVSSRFARVQADRLGAKRAGVCVKESGSGRRFLETAAGNCGGKFAAEACGANLVSRVKCPESRCSGNHESRSSGIHVSRAGGATQPSHRGKLRRRAVSKAVDSEVRYESGELRTQVEVHPVDRRKGRFPAAR